jgi:hypothetical protein
LFAEVIENYFVAEFAEAIGNYFAEAIGSYSVAELERRSAEDF